MSFFAPTAIFLLHRAFFCRGHRRKARRDSRSEHVACRRTLVRLETDGVAVRLNLLGQPGEQPDFVVASWVLPYVYALRGDRDWRRSPQLTGSRQVSQLAVQAYKLLEAGDATIPELKRALGREVTEGAVLRAITELWQQLRIIPVVLSAGPAGQVAIAPHIAFRRRLPKAHPPRRSLRFRCLPQSICRLLSQPAWKRWSYSWPPRRAARFAKCFAAWSPPARCIPSPWATRRTFTSPARCRSSPPRPPIFQLFDDWPPHTSCAHGSRERDALDFEARTPAGTAPRLQLSRAPGCETHVSRPPAVRKAASNGKSPAARPHFSRGASHSRDRKPAQTSNGSRPARRTSAESRTSGARTAASQHPIPPHRHRWGSKTPSSAKRNGAHAATVKERPCGQMAASRARPAAHQARAPRVIRSGMGPATTAIATAPRPRGSRAEPHASAASRQWPRV